MRAGLIALSLACLCCASKARTEAVQRLASRSAKERAAAVQALARVAKAEDDEAWTLLEHAARDGSPQVRAAAAAALGAAPRDEALDACGALLRDPDDAVRAAAARALGARCPGAAQLEDRARAWLRQGFSRSTKAVRPAIAEALARCGATLAQSLAHEERDRRAAARELLQATSGAQRARGAMQLGRLGRPEDVAQLVPLLGDRDGAVVAGAADALGEAGAAEAAPLLARLLAEEGSVAAAAARALRALGPDAVSAARDGLSAAAAREGDEAEPAAAALATLASVDRCAAAARALEPHAAALLAKDCPAGPLARRLSASRDPRGRGAALEALLVARGPAPEAAAPLAALLSAPEPDPRSCRAAERLGVAGPAVVALLQRERAAAAKKRIETPRGAAASDPEDEASAREIAAQAARGPVPSRAKYDQLMARIGQHQGAEATRQSAQEQLAALLRSDGRSSRRDLIVAALEAARVLQPPGADREILAWTADPDPAIAAAARGEPAPPLAAPAASASGRPPAGLDQLRADLWSSDGSERARACAALAQQGDEASAATRAALAQDPERRVRLACSPATETARPKKG